MTRKPYTILGMAGELWNHKSCEAFFGIGEDWVTLFRIASREKGKGHATELLREAKRIYESEGKDFGGSIALNPCMKHIYQKLGIKEYDEYEDYPHNKIPIAV